MRDPRDIASLLPQSGEMCLLERVERWDEDHVICRATSHRSPHNPLRRGGRLSAVHAVEYGAQAIAVHRALCGAAATPLPEIAFLASLRGVVIRVSHLDQLCGELEIAAQKLLGFADRALYRFTVRADGLPICEGRAGVVEPGRGP